jgi:hypothetical protein
MPGIKLASSIGDPSFQNFFSVIVYLYFKGSEVFLENWPY